MRTVNEVNSTTYPKMLITLDRLLLYYSLLLGIDVGFTKIRYYNNKPYYYLVTFINMDDNYINLNNLYNYSKKRGGRYNIYKGQTRKLNHIKTMKPSIHKMSQSNKLIIIDEISNYLHPIKGTENNQSLVNNMNRIVSSNESKHKLISYVKFMNSTSYDKDYVSKLLYLRYVILRPFNINTLLLNKEYYNDITMKLVAVQYAYKIPEIDKKINEVVEYFDTTDKSFATYIKSIHCLLWILTKYQDIEEDTGFTSFNKYALEKIITDDIKQQLEREEKLEGFYNKEDEELERLGSIILEYSDKYKDLYEQCFYTEDWNLIDLSRLIYYIDKYDLDVFTTLNILAADYSWAMYKLPKAQPGIQSTSIMVISNVGYSVDDEKDRTPEVQKMVDEINNSDYGLYLKDFNRSSEILIKLFKRTIEKQLVWGAQIF